jgi:hypothetical protein
VLAKELITPRRLHKKVIYDGKANNNQQQQTFLNVKGILKGFCEMFLITFRI